jgi:hypothetical protein
MTHIVKQAGAGNIQGVTIEFTIGGDITIVHNNAMRVRIRQPKLMFFGKELYNNEKAGNINEAYQIDSAINKKGLSDLTKGMIEDSIVRAFANFALHHESLDEFMAGIKAMQLEING